ncbi:hypothetical protein J437_LFUL002245 [Ladona fulva]|uniref:Uncharacterized protein n=1 Tax=Ladona fulva TaxID=123851 RepID=A0A8K0JY25_LADFU|nr:hypothetical protein J437_LFUL002245 [Ladona fulva]
MPRKSTDMGRKEAKTAPEGPSGSRVEEHRPRRPPSERWLLTRKTWRYMADAGRRLIPEGVSGDRPEDIPKIREHFSRLCKKEPRFLLWRKASFPGASPAARSRGRRRKEGRAGSEEPPTLGTLLEGVERTAAALGLPGSSQMLESPESKPSTSGASNHDVIDWGHNLPASVHVLKPDTVDRWVQTEPMPESLMRQIEETANAENLKDAQRKEMEAAKEAEAKGRRGSCPRDDLSPSVGDTIMRYLRMARKKSVDGDKSEKFRTVNYDRVVVKITENCSEEELIDGGMRRALALQSSDSWVKVLKSLGTPGLAIEGGVAGVEVCGIGEREEVTVETARLRVPISPPIACPVSYSSPPSSSSTAPASPPSSTPASPPRGSHQPSFLAQLLHGLQYHHNRHSAPPSPVLSPPAPSSPPTIAGSLPVLSAAAAAAASASGAPPVAAMQKSKSSSSVVASLAGRGPGGLVAKRIWRPRSRSTQGRTSPTTAAPASPPSAWIPQVGAKPTPVYLNDARAGNSSLSRPKEMRAKNECGNGMCVRPLIGKENLHVSRE